MDYGKISKSFVKYITVTDSSSLHNLLIRLIGGKELTMIRILSACGHSLVLAMTNIVAILVGFGVYNLLKPVNQIAVQVPFATMVCIIGFVSWCFLTRRLPFKEFAQPDGGELAWVYLAALLWSPILFVPLHYVSQGYLTSLGNILGLWLFQIPVNALAILAAYNRRRYA
jgi:hypothetical protein